MPSVMQQMLLGIGGTPLASATLTYLAHTVGASGTNTVFTTAGVPIGTASSGRIVFCTIHWLVNSSGNTTLSSATIGGIAANIHAQSNKVSGQTNNLGCAIISAVVPAGTTASVVVTMSASLNHFIFIDSYNATLLGSTTAISSITGTNPAPAATFSGAIDVKQGGVMIFAGTTYGDQTSHTIVGANKDYDTGTGVNYLFFGSSLLPTADQLNRTVSATRTGGAGPTMLGAYAAASFR